MDSPLPLLLYRLGTTALAPLAPAFLQWRQWLGKEEFGRRRERLAIDPASRPAGPLIWCHAVSVGEMRSILPVVGALPPGVSVLLTTTTVGAAQLAPAGVIQRYAPLDLTSVTRRFFDHWRPDLLLWTESELWPNLLGEASQRRLPALLLQGRLSERSHRRWRRIPTSAARVLSAFDLVLAQSEADAGRFRDLGASEVRVSGNLKSAAAAPPGDPAAIEASRSTIGNRPCWIAASTHAGEEAAAVTAHRMLQARYPGLLTMIAPRHPDRAEDIAALCTDMEVTRASREHPAGAIHVIDRLGELGLWYRLAQVAFLGGSLVPVGGHNPFEPASLALPLVHGPHTSNFAEAYAAMDAAGAAVKIGNADTLALVLGELLGDPDRRRRAGQAALAETAKGCAVLDTVMRAIDPWIRRLSA